MTLKLVHKIEHGKSATSYKFDIAHSAASSPTPLPDPHIREAIRAALEESSKKAKAASKPVTALEKNL